VLLLQCAAHETFTTHGTVVPAYAIYQIGPFDVAAPPGPARIMTALGYGVACHVLFALAVLSMIIAMFFGMSMSFGRVPEPYAMLANAALILQFPIVHSLTIYIRLYKIILCKNILYLI
jgi:hypothetical protein